MSRRGYCVVGGAVEAFLEGKKVFGKPAGISVQEQTFVRYRNQPLMPSQPYNIFILFKLPCWGVVKKMESAPHGQQLSPYGLHPLIVG
jgi:hypothetical protein